MGTCVQVAPNRARRAVIKPMQTAMVNPAAPALSSAVNGMADASRRSDVAAHNIANASTDPFSPLRPDGSQGAPGSMDLASEIVDGTMLAPVAYAANAQVVRTADSMRGTLLDIFA